MKQKLLKPAMVLFLVLATVMSGCSSTTRVMDSLREDLLKGDRSAAIELYEEKIAGDGEKMTEMNQALQSLVDEALAKYRSSEWDYTTVTSLLEGITDFPGAAMQAIEAIDVIDRNEAANEILRLAEESNKAGNYADAILGLESISSDLYCYTDAQAMLDSCKAAYLAALDADIESYLQQSQFEGAYALIVNAQSLLPTEESLAGLQTKVDAAYSAEAINKAQEQLDAKNYVQALQIVSSASQALPNDAALQAIYIEIGTEYVTVTQEQAVALAGTKDFDGAIGLLTIAVNNYPSETLDALIAEYQSYMPQHLSEMEYFQRDDYGFTVCTENLTDNLGNPHTFVLGSGDSAAWNGPESIWQSYRLGGKFDKMTGSFYLRYISRNKTKTGVLKIYGNDTLLYTSEKVTGGVDPVLFEIDLTGIDEMKVYIECNDYACGYFQIGDATLYPVTPFDE